MVLKELNRKLSQIASLGVADCYVDAIPVVRKSTSIVVPHTNKGHLETIQLSLFN